MRRNNEKGKTLTYNTGRGITSQTLLYQHMSNHYRRILNAKKSVDTAPPTTFKAKSNITCSASSAVRNFTATNKTFSIRNISPALTERTVSTCSNGGSYWGMESCYGRKGQNSRNNGCNCRNCSEINPNASEMELINQLAFDTKCGPANCFKTGWKANESRGNFRSPYETKKNTNHSNTSGIVKKTPVNKSQLTAVKRKISQKDRVSSDLMEKHSNCFITRNSSFRPRILKTNATSKLKTLKVYQPPKKKNGTRREGTEKEEAKVAMEHVNDIKSKSLVNRSGKCTACKCKQSINARETSQTSSRDSAYNGGISSLPESRSPTPDQRKSKSCCCHRKSLDTYYDEENIIVPNLKLTDNQNTQTEICEIPGRKDSKNEISDSCSSKTHDYKKESKNSFNDQDRDYFKRKIKEETLYTHFIRDITAEVLEKGLYTNKSLKKVMKRHVLSNLWILDKNRMMKEIDKLRIQLGIPEDEDLMNIKIESAGSGADLDEYYSVISDSELIESSYRKNQKTNSFKRNGIAADASDSEKLLPKSISDVMYQTDENNQLLLDTESDDEDEELISVIHVTKLVKDKKRNDSYIKELHSDTSDNGSQGNSADESEQSSDHVTRKKKPHSRFRKIEKTSSSSDDHKFSRSENKRYSGGKSDGNAYSPKRKGTKSSKDGKEEVEKSEQ